MRSSVIGISSIIAVLLLAVSAAAGYYLLGELPALELERTLTSNLGFFLLINLNIIVVMVLGFLVIKNLVKLVLDRRAKILGARLRSRLVAAFVGLSLVPTVLLLTVAKGMLDRGMSEWFSPQIESSVDGALQVAHYYYEQEEGRIGQELKVLVGQLAQVLPTLKAERSNKLRLEDPEAREVLRTFLARCLRQQGLFAIALVGPSGESILEVRSREAEGGIVKYPAINLGTLALAISGEPQVGPEQSLNDEFLRGYAPIVEVSKDLSSGVVELEQAGFALVITRWVRPQLSAALGVVVNGYDDFKELKTYRRPLASSYFLTLVVITLLIVFAAIWVGFYLARDLSIPIGLLAEGTQQVAHGNLDHRIPEVGDDELSVLVRSFNKMTKDLDETTGELESRRRYMETILARVGVGVFTVDLEGRLTTFNIAAFAMLGMDSVSEVFERRYREVLPGALAERVSLVLENLYSSTNKILTEDFTLDLSSGSKQIQLTATELVDEKQRVLGAVVLLDDLTELVNAQRMAAWQEVARRIAHEIKNPLTPIQLCAERMRRKFGLSPEIEDGARLVLSPRDQEVIRESTETIESQVENLRTLVNEFSQFARMPRANLLPGDINSVLQETVAIYREAHPDILFQLALDEEVPMIAFDREQINRVIINLLENSVASLKVLEEEPESSERSVRGATKKAIRSMSSFLGGAAALRSGSDPSQLAIELSSTFNPELGLVSITLSDNGVGISNIDKGRVFEPYYSTKGNGTGLGLTIVNTIVKDHSGFVRVRDNEPRGTCFIIELPVARDAMRKIA